MNRSECPDVSPVTPELWDRIRAGLKKNSRTWLVRLSIFNIQLAKIKGAETFP